MSSCDKLSNIRNWAADKKRDIARFRAELDCVANAIIEDKRTVTELEFMLEERESHAFDKWWTPAPGDATYEELCEELYSYC